MLDLLNIASPKKTAFVKLSSAWSDFTPNIVQMKSTTAKVLILFENSKYSLVKNN
jgi:hypothetical protein